MARQHPQAFLVGGYILARCSVVALHFAKEKGASIGPPAIRGGAGDMENGGGLLGGKAGEESQLDELRFAGVFLVEQRQSFIKGQKVDPVVEDFEHLIGDLQFFASAT